MKSLIWSLYVTSGVREHQFFYSFLLTTCINKRTKDSTWFGSLALAGSILLKQKNAEMSATASLMGVLLKSKSIEVCSSFYKFISLHSSLPYLSMIHLGTLSIFFFFLPSKFPQLVKHRIVHAIFLLRMTFQFQCVRL